MTNKKSARQAFVMSIVSLLLCCTMLVGTTFAWFTDEVVSSNNIIKSGTLDVEMSWTDSINSGSTVTNDTDVTVTWALGNSSSGCLAEGTLITLADGTQKPIEQITYEDELLVWDFHTGTYAVTVPSLIEAHAKDEFRVINLKFADETTVRVIVDHGFFDVEEYNFVFIDESNVDFNIGHKFVKLEKDGMFTLSAPPEMLDNDGWFDYFEIGDGMKYDEAKMKADIAKYGLYTYEEFAEYVTYEQFIAFNGPYLKILVGKGIVTFDQILKLIATYVNP